MYSGIAPLYPPGQMNKVDECLNSSAFKVKINETLTLMTSRTVHRRNPIHTVYQMQARISRFHITSENKMKDDIPHDANRYIQNYLLGAMQIISMIIPAQYQSLNEHHIPRHVGDGQPLVECLQRYCMCSAQHFRSPR